MPKHFDHSWLIIAFYTDRVEIYYAGHLLRSIGLLAILGTLVLWLFAYIIELAYPGRFMALGVIMVPTISQIGSELPAVTLASFKARLYSGIMDHSPSSSSPCPSASIILG